MAKIASLTLNAMKKRNYTLIDQVCLCFDQALRTVCNSPHTTNRRYPAQSIPETQMTSKERQHAGAILRINHAGEVAAQALYQAQSITSDNISLKETLQEAAVEEGDHLAWCQKRIVELGSHTSYLNPFWYAGSFIIGLIAGTMGDQWSVSFLAETEHQVVMHLEHQLKSLHPKDKRSAAILQQMQCDEANHRDHAHTAGAHNLPNWIKKSMRFLSQVMVKTAYWV